MKLPPEILTALNNPEKIQEELARRDFLEFRIYMNPRIKVGWFVRQVAEELQQFYEDLVAGKKPTLVIEAPPQHGKSIAIIDFLAWIAGKNPDLKKIYTSFSDRLGVRANLRLQRMYESERYQRVFPSTRISSSNNSISSSGKYLRNKEILEYVDREGFFRNTTVRGSITGESLDLGIIDDPIKGREEANSLTVRDKTWEWLTDDFFTRFSEEAGLLCILTRWHIDDPIGRLKDYLPGVKVLSYKAIAEEDEEFRKAGDPLFPEHKSLEFLLKRKSMMLNANWLALYQQSPIIKGGNMIKVDKIKILDVPPADIVASVRYWDKAGTEGGGAHTAGVLIGKTKGGIYVILDVVRGQWAAPERERRIKQTAVLDGTATHIWVEQEPGSGGKESAESTVKRLAGYTAKSERVTGAKEIRAEPYAAQVEAGNVHVVKANWNREFISENETFPHGKYKDQVDAAAAGFQKLATMKVLGFTSKQVSDNMKTEKSTVAPKMEEQSW